MDWLSLFLGAVAGLLLLLVLIATVRRFRWLCYDLLEFVEARLVGATVREMQNRGLKQLSASVDVEGIDEPIAAIVGAVGSSPAEQERRRRALEELNADFPPYPADDEGPAELQGDREDPTQRVGGRSDTPPADLSPEDLEKLHEAAEEAARDAPAKRLEVDPSVDRSSAVRDLNANYSSNWSAPTSADRSHWADELKNREPAAGMPRKRSHRKSAAASRAASSPSVSEPAQPERRAGRLIHNTPAEMRAHAAVDITVRIVRDETNAEAVRVALIMPGGAEVRSEAIETDRVMSVKLYGRRDLFSIDTSSSPTQYTNGTRPFAEWKFGVLPLKSGTHDLELAYESARYEGGQFIADGSERHVIRIKVRVNSARIAVDSLKYVAGIAFVALVTVLVTNAVGMLKWPPAATVPSVAPAPVEVTPPPAEPAPPEPAPVAPATDATAAPATDAPPPATSP